jgi:hypothetical protein
MIGDVWRIFRTAVGMLEYRIVRTGKKRSFFKIFGFGIVFFMFIGSIHIHKGNLINDIILNLN